MFFGRRLTDNVLVTNRSILQTASAAPTPERIVVPGSDARRKFPGLISGPTIDWFLPWPEEALVSVSHGLVADFPMDCPGETKGNLMTHMGVVHRMVTEVC